MCSQMAGRISLREADNDNNTKKGSMNTQHTLAILAALGKLASVAGAQPADGEAPAPRAAADQFERGRPDPEMHKKFLTEKYDANKDGKLDDAELAAIGKDVVEGKLRPPMRQGRPGQDGPGMGEFPRQQAPENARGPRPPRPPEFERSGQPGMPPERAEGFAPEGRGDGSRRPLAMNREGAPGRGEFGNPPRGRVPEAGRRSSDAHRQELIKKYDANGDGKLDATEREAIGRDIEEGKLPTPPLRPQQAPGEPQPPRAPE